MQRGENLTTFRPWGQNDLLDQQPQSRRCRRPFVGLGEGGGQRRNLFRIDGRGAWQQVRYVLGNICKLLGQFGLARFERCHLPLHTLMEHAFLDRLDNAPDLLLDLRQLRFPCIAVRAAFPVQPVGLFREGAHGFRSNLRGHHPVLEAGKHATLQLLAQNGAIVGAGALGHMGRAGEPIRASNGEGATTAAAEDQARKQGLRPVGAIQAVFLVMFADAFGDVGIFG